MHKKLDYMAYLYAQEEKLGIKQIKEGIYPLDIDVSKTRDYMDKNSIGYVVCVEAGFHPKLTHMPAKPHIVYYMGDISLLHYNILGIVGPRLMSLYGQQVLDMLFEELQGREIVTISGGADGVDRYAHISSMKRDIPTIVVLGGGLGHFLESGKNTFLKKIVEKGGLILSEFKLFTTPTKYTFPQRNRIIAALSSVLFVPEAAEKSGSLITVDVAHTLGTHVYGAMNDVFSPSSKGTNTYIQQGIITPVCDMKPFLDRHFGFYAKKVIESEQVHFADTKIPDLGLNLEVATTEQDFLINKSLKELGIV